jgi:hypothetical protein
MIRRWRVVLEIELETCFRAARHRCWGELLQTGLVRDSAWQCCM